MTQFEKTLYSRAGRTCLLHAGELTQRTQTQNMYYCFSTVKMVTRTRLNITFMRTLPVPLAVKQTIIIYAVRNLVTLYLRVYFIHCCSPQGTLGSHDLVKIFSL
jgi:hypothetical protein